MASLPTEKSTASFWHSEPSKYLLGHQTTPNLPEKADIVIVGSGITGSSTARFLCEDARAKDLSIVMLEAREACWGATGRNGGHCQPLLFDSTPDVAEFELRNVAAVEAYIEANAVPCEWRSVAGCRTFWTKTLADVVQKHVQNLTDSRPEIGQRITVVKDKEELGQKYKVNGPECATLTVSAGCLWPYKLIAFILEKLIKSGSLNLQTSTPVTSISRDREHLPDSTEARGRRYTVTTPRGEIAANHIVLATNAYTSHLLPEFSDLIVPERGVMSALLPPQGSERLQNSYGFIGAMGANQLHDDYLIQRPFQGVPNPAGHLMFGGGRAASKLNAIGEIDDSILDEGSAQYLRHALLKLMALGGKTEGLEELKASHVWSGIWGTSKDHHPWVGAVPGRPDIWLCGGYSGKRKTKAPKVFLSLG